jgi:monoamine oxidase
MARLRHLHQAHEAAAGTGIPVDEVIEQSRCAPPASEGPEPPSESRIGRRTFLAAGAAVSTAAISATALPNEAAAASPAVTDASRRAGGSGPRVAIVGAGLAGLSCASSLWHRPHPIASTVYEANPGRVGGRCWSLRDYFDDGLIGEHGGAFINSDQHQIRRLAASLGLQEEVVHGGDLLTGEEVYYFDDGYYTLSEANADWASVGFPTFKRALHQSRHPDGLAALDAMSVPEWLDSTDIGTGSRLGRLMLANTVSENGGDPSDQSALDLIVLCAYNPRSSIVPLPGDDEKYHIIGGNDQIVSGLVSRLPVGTVQGGHELVAVRRRGREVVLTFDVAGTVTEESADLVVMALPFNVLRNVDLTRSGMSRTKRRVIDTMGMGTNAKVHVEVTRKTWPPLGFSGVAYDDMSSFDCAWDDSVPLGPDGAPAILLFFPGAEVGRTGLTGAAHGPAPAADVDWFLSDIEPIFPGTTAAYAGKAWEDHWALDPWVGGAYSYFRVGQAATYGTLTKAPDGPYHFAGEHTCTGNIGFLDGAVASGERAAREIVALA